jgi:hypothetical protein
VRREKAIKEMNDALPAVSGIKIYCYLRRIKYIISFKLRDNINWEREIL